MILHERVNRYKKSKLTLEFKNNRIVRRKVLNIHVEIIEDLKKRRTSLKKKIQLLSGICLRIELNMDKLKRLDRTIQRICELRNRSKEIT